MLAAAPQAAGDQRCSACRSLDVPPAQLPRLMGAPQGGRRSRGLLQAAAVLARQSLGRGAVSRL